MTEIIFLGTAGAVASSTRDNTSLLITSGKERILIDCPGSIVAKLSKINIDFRKISCIFATHAHPDHIYGIISLLHSQYELKNKIYIYATLKVINIIKNIRRIFKLDDINKFPEVIFKRISPSDKKPFCNSKDVKSFAFKVKHKPGSVGFKFLFKKQKISCVYSGDSARSLNLIRQATGCDYLIHDCFGPSRFFKQHPELNSMHTSSLALGQIARNTSTGVLIPIHFAQEIRYSMSEVKKEINKNFKGKLIIPKDLGRLKLVPRPS